ncbi:MAG: HD domain-containing phosphohydrolase [Candidatus Omnitrophota bacterium]
MTELSLSVDLYDITKKLIIKSGSTVDFKLVRHLLDHGSKLKKTLIPFGTTELFKHFSNVFNEEKYFTIFTPYSLNEEIKEYARQTEITKELYEELKFTREFLPYTFRHVLLVTAMIIKLSIDLKDKGYKPEHAAIIGLVHDLGKTRISKQILGKDTPLTQSEYETLKSHSLISYLLLCYYLGHESEGITSAVRDHHEKLDGSGYPRKSMHINKYARLIAPIDIFDALISERPYRSSPFTLRQAMDHLVTEANAGRIDRDIVFYLISYIRKEHPHPGELQPYSGPQNNLPADNMWGKVIPDGEISRGTTRSL